MCICFLLRIKEGERGLPEVHRPDSGPDYGKPQMYLLGFEKGSIAGGPP